MNGGHAFDTKFSPVTICYIGEEVFMHCTFLNNMYFLFIYLSFIIFKCL